jgi:hypothetical protein
VDYRDKPPSNETGSRFNRRNRAKWVRIQPALTMFHQIKQRHPILRPKLYLPYREFQALAVL